MISKERRALLNEVLRRASRSIHDYNYISLSMESWNPTTYGDPTCIRACASPLARLRPSSSLSQVESARWQNFADCFARGPPLRHWRRKGGDIKWVSERIAPMSYMPEQQVQNWACEFRRTRVTEALLDKTILIDSSTSTHSLRCETANLPSWCMQFAKPIHPAVLIHCRFRRFNEQLHLRLRAGFSTIAHDRQFCSALGRRTKRGKSIPDGV